MQGISRTLPIALPWSKYLIPWDPAFIWDTGCKNKSIMNCNNQKYLIVLTNHSCLGLYLGPGSVSKILEKFHFCLMLRNDWLQTFPSVHFQKTTNCCSFQCPQVPVVLKNEGLFLCYCSLEACIPFQPENCWYIDQYSGPFTHPYASRTQESKM